MDIRFCSHGDIAPVMGFIDQHWSRGHIMATSRTLMDWQHGGTGGRDYDYVLASRGDEILGCLGFILTSRFDPGLEDDTTIWLALWKAREDAPPGLGLQMLGFLQKHIPHRSIGTVGINVEVAKLYRALGYHVENMRQHYVLHPEYEHFELAQIPGGAPRRAGSAEGASAPSLRRLDADSVLTLQHLFDEAWPTGCLPRKSARFFRARFIEHPYYRYALYAIERDGRPQGLLAARLCEVGGRRALRLVDGFLPPAALPQLAAALQELLRELDAEYADLYQSGLDADALARSGLLSLDDLDGEVIIPNYYEPFLRKNVSVTWAYKIKPGQSVLVYKADADQDRPSRVE